MDTLFAEILGIAILLASVAGTTVTLSGRTRRGSGRVSLALMWISVGVIGLTAIDYGLAPKQPGIVLLGGIVATGVVVSAVTLGVLRHHDLDVARRRDAALGQPPIPRVASTRSIVWGSGLVSLITSVSVIAPWMLIAAAAAGIPPGRIVAGLTANAVVATPLVWIAIASLVLAHRRRVAVDADLLRRGIALRVADAEAAAYRNGFDAGREEGYHHAAFGTSWE